MYILADDLYGGYDYSFSVWMIDKHDIMNNIKTSRREMTIRVGCYHPSITQCCGRGICTINDGDHNHSDGVRSIIKPYCKCDVGYSGDHCDYYQVQVHDGVMANISAFDSICSTTHHIIPVHKDTTTSAAAAPLI